MALRKIHTQFRMWWKVVEEAKPWTIVHINEWEARKREKKGERNEISNVII